MRIVAVSLVIFAILLVSLGFGMSNGFGASAEEANAALPVFLATPTPPPQPSAIDISALESRDVMVLGSFGSTWVFYPYFNEPRLDGQIYSKALNVADIDSVSPEGGAEERKTNDPQSGRIIDYILRTEENGLIKLIFTERLSESAASAEHIAAYLIDTQALTVIDEREAAAAILMEPTLAGSIKMAKITPAPTKSGGKMIALTFDDGPSSYTSTLLGVLRANNAKATFCVLGERIKNNKSVIQQMAAQGCEVVGHSWDHSSLDKLGEDQIRSQIRNTASAIEAITGVRTRLYRPPYGATNSLVRSVSRDLNMGLLMWSIDTEDWKYRNPTRLYDYIMENVTPGCIILCHDIHQTTVEGMKKIIPELVKRGYNLVTVSELMGFSDAVPVAGRLYYNK